MKITKFRICNYRAIADIEFSLANAINPIIGVNESGKTSILQAILAFDKNQDRVNNGNHLVYKNKYKTGDPEQCTISCYFKLDEDEIKNLIQRAKSKNESDDFLKLSNISESSEVVISRRFSGSERVYTFDSFDLSGLVENRVTKYLQEIFPQIIYFDDFTDRVPDEIFLGIIPLKQVIIRAI